MKSEKITIVNFCQHRFLVQELTDGLIAVIGANGSGKSNFMGAIRFALTGDNPNAGTKLENICALAPVTENSYVELEFSHGDVRATVRRNLRPASPSAILTLAGGEIIHGDRKVTAKIEEILGISTDIVNDIMIVSQDDIFGFLAKAKAKRAEQFQRLFHTGQAAVVYKAIGEQLKSVHIPAVGVDMDELRRDIQQHTAQAGTLEENLTHLPSFTAITDGRAENSKVVRDYTTRNALHARHTSDLELQASLQVALSNMVVQQQAAAAELSTLQAAAAGNEAAAAAARATLANLDSRKRMHAARITAEQALTRIIKQMTIAILPEPPADYGDVVAMTKTLTVQAVDIEKLDRFIQSFAADVAECPTCGTATDTLQGRLAESAARLNLLTAEASTSRAQLHRSQAYDTAAQQYQQQHESLVVQKQQAENNLAAFPEEETGTGDEIQLSQRVQQQETYAQGVSEYTTAVSQCDQQVAGLNGQLSQLTSSVQRVAAELLELPEYTADQQAMAAQNIVTWDGTAATRRDREQQLAVATTNKLQCEQRLAQAAGVEEEATLLRGWEAFAQEMRGIVHKDAAPRFVAQRNLQRLQVGINENLEAFGAAFRVQADEGLTFRATFQDGVSQPASRLSGGEKVILALMFRLALNLMFAENIGALYLDEPTAYLDEQHIRGFEPILAQLREFSASRGLQCIIITHERDLAPLFDSVVQL